VLDTAFLLPRLRMAAISDLVGARGVDESWKFEEAWARRHRMGEADRAALLTHVGARYPAPPSLAERIAAAEHAVKVAPRRAESWFVLGENLQRFGSLTDVPDWRTRATAALERALALDSTNAMTLDRLVLMDAWAGDSGALARHAASYLRFNESAESSQFIAWLRAQVTDDTVVLAATRRGFPAMSSMSLQRIVMWSQELGIGIGDLPAAAAALEGRVNSAARRNTSMNRNVRGYLNAGQPDSARWLLANGDGQFGPQQGVSKDELRLFAALYWDGDRTDAANAAGRIARSLADAATAPSSACALAHWRLQQGNVAGADSALRFASAATRRRVPDSRLALPVCLASAVALRESAVGMTSSATLERLDSLLRHSLSARDMVYDVGNVLAARLFEQRGENARALRIARRRATWNAFLSTQLLQEARLAAATGDRAGAARAYRHFLALRSSSQPQLREQVSLAQQELRRLNLELSGSPRP
jgi:hypothetical protein